MAIINYTLENLDKDRMLVIWSGGVSDLGEAFDVPWAPATLMWQGYSASAFEVHIEGANQDTGDFPLNTAWPLLVTINQNGGGGPGLQETTIPCRFFRPRITAASATTTIVLFLVRL
jgi:hypothetical protein